VVADADELIGFDALAAQLVQNALAAHDVAQALDGLIVIEVGAIGKLLDFLAGYDKIVAVAGHMPGLVTF
jgi:hypothetical protein